MMELRHLDINRADKTKFSVKAVDELCNLRFSLRSAVLYLALADRTDLRMPRTRKGTVVCIGSREVWTDYEEAKAHFLAGTMAIEDSSSIGLHRYHLR